MGHDTTAVRITRAAHHIFEREGAEAVSMRRVATIVGITPMAIYRHFADRTALLNAIADSGFVDLTRRFEGVPGKSPTELVDGLMNGYLDFALERPRLFEYMFSARREGARRFPQDFEAGRSPTANLLAMHVRNAMKSGKFRKDDVWEVTLALIAQAHGLIALYMGGRFQLPETEFRSLFRRTMRRLLHGITQ